MSTLPSPKYFNATTPPHITTLVLMAAIGTIAMNVFLASLPAMAVHFDVSYAVIQFTITGYLALTSIAQVLLGPISDRFGRRPVMLICGVIYIAASFGAALTDTFATFMIFRCIQAAIVSGMVLSKACVRDMVSREDAASMMGYVTMGMAMAPMLAPAMGGILQDAFGWQANFYVQSLLGIIVITVVWFDLGETNQHKSTSFTAQFRAYPELLRSRRFWGYALVLMFASGTFFAYLGGAPYVGTQVYGLNASQVGIYLGITPMGYMIGNGISGRFANQIGLHRMMILGVCVLLTFMSGALISAWIGVQHPLGFFGFTIAIGLGNGLILPAANAGLLDVNPRLAGSAAGLGGAVMTLGGAILASIAAALLGIGSGAIPLLLCILSTAVCCFLAVIYTIRQERLVNHP